MAELDPDTMSGIRKEAKQFLRRADALDVFLPTPVDHIVEVPQLVQDPDWLLSDSMLKKADSRMREILRRARGKLRGTLSRKERIISIDPDLEGTVRGRFVKCHETMHHVLPWQRDLALFGDTDNTLSPAVDWGMDQEANQGGAELLFQLDVFDKIARDYPTTLATPVELSQMAEASIHAPIRRWVEGHEHALCVLVLDQASMSFEPMRIKVKYSIESVAWRGQVGSNISRGR